MSQDTSATTQPQVYTPQVARCRTCGRTAMTHTVHCEAHQLFAGQAHLWRHGEWMPEAEYRRLLKHKAP